MGRPKKVTEEINIEFPSLPIEDMPIEEPSIDEQIRNANQELENRCNDLIYQLYNKEQENEELRRAMQEQAANFEKTIANLVWNFCGPNR